MDIDFVFWYAFPVAILIASIAMASGIGGAIFFSPFFILILGLDTKVALGTALMTEMFGFSSGLYAYSKNKLIDYKLGKKVLLFSIPAALVGLYLARFFHPDILKAVFAVGILFLAYQIFIAWRQEEREKKNQHKEEINRAECDNQHTDSSGETYYYKTPNQFGLRSLSSVGGLFVGMISVGLGELLDYFLVAKSKIPTPVAVGTAVFTVVFTVLAASLGHFYEFFFNSPEEVTKQVVNVVVFTIPGVLIGGQIGPRLQKIIPESIIKVSISILFIIVSILMLFTLI